MSKDYQPLAGILTEEEVINFLGVTKDQLSVLRNTKRLPFVKVNTRIRLYFEHDLIEFFKENRIILNKELDPD